MESVATKAVELTAGQAGLAGLLAALIIWFLYTQFNKKEKKLDDYNSRLFAIIENDTKATLGAAAAQNAQTEAMKALTEKIRPYTGNAHD